MDRQGFISTHPTGAYVIIFHYEKRQAMTPAQPAITYSEYGPDGIWSGNPLDVILSSGLGPADLPDDTELPYEDGIPLESNWHRHQMNLLIELIEYHWQ